MTSFQFHFKLSLNQTMTLSRTNTSTEIRFHTLACIFHNIYMPVTVSSTYNTFETIIRSAR